MGNLQAKELGEQQALEWHLTCNHYPSMDKRFAPACREAIEKAAVAILSGNEAWWLEQVAVKDEKGRVLRRYTVQQIYEDLHLDTFVEARIEEMEDETDE